MFTAELSRYLTAEREREIQARLRRNALLSRAEPAIRPFHRPAQPASRARQHGP